MKEGYINKINVVKKGMVWKIYGVTFYASRFEVKDNSYIGKICYNTRDKMVVFIKGFFIMDLGFISMSQIIKTMKEYSIEVLGNEIKC